MELLFFVHWYPQNTGQGKTSVIPERTIPFLSNTEAKRLDMTSYRYSISKVTHLSKT